MGHHTIRLQRTRPPPAAEGLEADEHLGRWLAAVVQQAFERAPAGPAPAAVVLRDDDTVELVPLTEPLVREAPLPLLLAGLSQSVVDERRARAVGVIGRFRMQRRTDRGVVGVPVLVSFLEWSDCRWVSWRRVLDPRGQALGDGETWHRAVDGDALPDGLGRWWSLGRRTGARLDFRPAPSETVH